MLKFNFSLKIKKLKFIKKLIITSILVLLIGKILWELEQNFCIYYPRIYIFHSIWHNLTAYVIHLNIYFFYYYENIDLKIE